MEGRTLNSNSNSNSSASANALVGSARCRSRGNAARLWRLLCVGHGVCLELVGERNQAATAALVLLELSTNLRYPCAAPLSHSAQYAAYPPR